MALKIHQLAKELGVKSKDVLDKCQAEGLPQSSHNAVVSAGLEATIREWFSEGAAATAVESAAPVDLKKVRKRRKKEAEEAPVPEAVEAPVGRELERGAGMVRDLLGEREQFGLFGPT